MTAHRLGVGGATAATPPEAEPADRSQNGDEAERKQIADLFAKVLDTVPCGLFSLDAVGIITSWNDEMSALTGYQPDEAIGQRCIVLEGSTCADGPCPSQRDTPCSLFTDGQVRDKRCDLKCKDGSSLPVVKNARLMHDADGRVVGAVEAVTDLRPVLHLERQVQQLRSEAAGRARYAGLIGRHPTMQKLYERIQLAAQSPAAVLVFGETGTGKELVARAIHDASPRSKGPFVRVSCAALSESLLESELFGHVRGAFTGATTDRKGRFELAHGGTLFLDEIGDVSPAVQTKLLRVLQEHEVERVGDASPIKVDIRVVAATNKPLRDMAAGGMFREDLYYRLAVIPLQIPPLRERASDIPLLVDHFVERQRSTLGREHIHTVSPLAMQLLVHHRWPGNVRELEHAIEYAFVVTPGPQIDEASLPETIATPERPSETSGSTRRRRGRPGPERILKALSEADGNRTQAAAALGVSRVTLWKWLKNLELAGHPIG